jgi:hypothetical protein
METPYVWAWVAVGVSALVLLLALQRALRRWHAPLFKALAGWWLLLVLITPAQVPRHAEDFAPAFLVYLFEALLQREGNPAAAGRILAAASAGAIVLGLLTWLAGRLRRRGAAPA